VCRVFGSLTMSSFARSLLKAFRSLQLRHLRRLLRRPVEFRASCGLDSSVCGARRLARLARSRVTAGALGFSCVARVCPTDAALKSPAPASLIERRVLLDLEQLRARSLLDLEARANKRLLQAADVRRFCFDARSSPALFPHGGSGPIVSSLVFDAAAEAQVVSTAPTACPLQ
jgi:hypothetical protein